MKQYPSFIYTKTQSYIFPIVGLRFFVVVFCTIQELRNPNISRNVGMVTYVAGIMLPLMIAV